MRDLAAPTPPSASRSAPSRTRLPSAAAARPEMVIKLGGSLARDPDALRHLAGALSRLDRPPLVVPGGGRLADAVRALHAAAGLSEATAHRMALLALDQMALWLADLTAGPRRGTVVRLPEEIARVVCRGGLPVLAPSRWLSAEDSRSGALPASWAVTSDSIAAWCAGELGVRRMILVKSFGFRSREVAPEELGDAVDAFFLRCLPRDVECRFVNGRDPAAVDALARGDPVGTLLRR